MAREQDFVVFHQDARKINDRHLDSYPTQEAANKDAVRRGRQQRA
jgi:hypothetical protein